MIVSDFAKFGMPIPPEHLQPPPKMSPRSAADTYTSMNQLSGKIARDAVAHAMTVRMAVSYQPGGPDWGVSALHRRPCHETEGRDGVVHRPRVSPPAQE